MHLHSFSPYLWQISDSFGVQWNGLFLMLSFLLSFVFISWMAYRQRSELVPRLRGDFVFVCVASLLIGGRLGYVFFHDLTLFFKFRADFPFWGVLAVHEGGMSVYGGMIGLWAGATLFAIRTGVSRLYLYDLMAVTAPIGLFFGRISSFLTGELIGRPVDPSSPLSQFAVKFPTEILSWPQSQPAQLVQLTPVVEKAGMDTSQWSTVLSQNPATPESQNAIYEALTRILEAVQSGNSEVQNALAPLLADRHPAQLYSALTEGSLLFLFLFFLWYRPRTPGVVSASFLILYSVIRFSMEMFRMPDATNSPGFLDLTRGQWLSVICFFVGLVLAFMWGRRETLASPGWGRGQSVKLHRR